MDCPGSDSQQDLADWQEGMNWFAQNTRIESTKKSLSPKISKQNLPVTPPCN